MLRRALCVGILLGGVGVVCSATALESGGAGSPFSGRGMLDPQPYTAEELDELDGLEETVKRFAQSAKSIEKLPRISFDTNMMKSVASFTTPTKNSF